MTTQRNGPPNEVGAPAGTPLPDRGHRQPTRTDLVDTQDITSTGADPSYTFDGLTAGRRRREAALRCSPTGRSGDRDPVHGGSRLHRPSTGLRANGFRDGYTSGALDALRQLWPNLDDVARASAADLAAKYHEAAAA